MKKLLSICVFTLLTTLLTAQVSKTIDVPTTGMLSSLLTMDEKWSITSLTLTGCIDSRDVKCLRDEVRNLSILDLSSVTIKEYNGNNGTSSYITSYPANTLPNQSFWSSGTGAKTSLITVYLPNNLNIISSFAFSDCIGLKSITIPNSVTSIESNAFSGCDGLTSIIIPNSVLKIGDNAFGPCRGLTNLTIGNSVTTIGVMAFGFCLNLTSIVIPNSVTKIGNYAFCNCDKLSKITIPNYVESIGERAFQNCSELSSLTIGNLVSTIGDYAFSNCIKLETIHILNINPPVLGNCVFTNFNTYGYQVNGAVKNVFVNTSSVNTYKSDSGWNYYFYPIISADNNILSSTPELTNCSLKVYTKNSEIIIDGTSKGETVTLFTLNGKQIQTIMSKGEKLYLPADRNTVYLVKTGDKTFKVIM